jgi:hypothetical protein
MKYLEIGRVGPSFGETEHEMRSQDENSTQEKNRGPN